MKDKSKFLLILLIITVTLSMLVYVVYKKRKNSDINEIIADYAVQLPYDYGKELYLFTESVWVGDFSPVLLMCENSSLNCEKVYGIINSFDKEKPVMIQIHHEGIYLKQENIIGHYDLNEMTFKEAYPRTLPPFEDCLKREGKKWKYFDGCQ